MFELFSKHSNTFLHSYVLMTSIVHLNRIIENILPILQFILHVFFSYNMYTITNKECKIKIIKNMKNYYCYCYDDNRGPLKLIVEKSLFPSYFAYNEEMDDIYVFCKQDKFRELIQENYVKREIVLNEEHIPLKSKDDNFDEKDDLDTDANEKCDALLEQKCITYLSLSGTYGHSYINERHINLSNIHHLDWYSYQTDLFRNIMDFYKKNNYCKIYLNGSPGKGKTFFAYLMAQKLNCYLTDQYNPTDPGCSLNMVYHNAKKISPNKPLIILLDEVDVLLSKIHKKEITKHKHYKCEIYDKISWNQFHDKISYGLYPFLIIIMISNQSKNVIDTMDPAFLRKGRTDIYQEWK